VSLLIAATSTSAMAKASFLDISDDENTWKTDVYLVLEVVRRGSHHVCENSGGYNDGMATVGECEGTNDGSKDEGDADKIAVETLHLAR
jgi:hypothetical protein